jgi:hypothetical protein
MRLLAGLTRPQSGSRRPANILKFHEGVAARLSYAAIHDAVPSCGSNQAKSVQAFTGDEIDDALRRDPLYVLAVSVGCSVL